MCERLSAATLSTLQAYHAEHALEPGAPVQWLRSRLDASDEVASAVILRLAEAGLLSVGQGIAATAQFRPAPSDAQTRLRDAMLATLEKAGAEPPTLEELMTTLHAPAETISSLARWLSRERLLIAVEPNRYYTWHAIGALRAKMAAGMEENRSYAPGELRDLLGLTRKFLIPFLEYCDREGYTVRDGLGRRLRGT
jgi:selenocysteine-specific elongation factor